MFVLKRRSYDGATTVVCSYSQQSDAQEDADTMNSAYQSKQYYVEPFDAAKLANFTGDNNVHEIYARVGGGIDTHKPNPDYLGACSKSLE